MVSSEACFCVWRMPRYLAKLQITANAAKPKSILWSLWSDPGTPKDRTESLKLAGAWHFAGSA
jgi:hypothetical protein